MEPPTTRRLTSAPKKIPKGVFSIDPELSSIRAEGEHFSRVGLQDELDGIQVDYDVDRVTAKMIFQNIKNPRDVAKIFEGVGIPRSIKRNPEHLAMINRFAYDFLSPEDIVTISKNPELEKVLESVSVVGHIRT